MIPMTFRNIQIDATNHRGRGKAFSINTATIIRMLPIMPHTAHRPQIKRCFLSICFPLNAYQKTFTVVTAPKSTESTNSTMPAYSFVPLIFTRGGTRGGAHSLTCLIILPRPVSLVNGLRDRRRTIGILPCDRLTIFVLLNEKSGKRKHILCICA